MSRKKIGVTKIGTALDQLSPPIRGKKFGEIWFANKKSYRHSYHLFADDKQLYTAVPSDEIHVARQRLTSYISVLRD